MVRNITLSLLGGHIDVAIMTPSSALAQIKNGDIRLLGIISAERNEYFPNVPTFKEQGYDVVASIWRSVMVKAGTPKGIIDTLMSAIQKMQKSKEWRVFSGLNMQSSVNISLDDINAVTRKSLATRAFLEATGLAERGG